jgi:hypothetical protein
MESSQKNSIQTMMQVKSDPIESSAGHDPDDLPNAITEE